jgi:regulator of replication initiation timing
MGWILDLFNCDNLAPEFATKLNDLESKFAVLERQNVALKLEVEKLREQGAIKDRENQRLQAETYKTKELAVLLEEPKHRILVALHRHQSLSQPSLLARLQMNPTELDYYIDELLSDLYIDFGRHSPLKPRQYRLAQKGRKYIIDQRSSLEP